VQQESAAPVRRRKRPLDVCEFSASPMCGRSAAPMHVKYIGDYTASPTTSTVRFMMLPPLMPYRT